MEKRIEKIVFGMIMIMLVMLAIGCSPAQNTVVKKEDFIRIGVVAPLTGEAASYGLAAKEGLDFAAQQINSNDGVLGKKLQLIYDDSQADPKQAVTIMNKFISINKVDIVIAADGSGATTAIAPFADQTQTLMIATLASTPLLKDMGDYVFRTVPSDAYQGTEFVRLADNKGFETAAILYVNDAYGIGIKDIFMEKFSGKTLIAEAFENGDIDFRTQLTKIKGRNPDVILIIARKELPNILDQIEALKIGSELMASETAKDEELIKTAGDSAEGLYTLFYTDPVDYRNYRGEYKERYGRDPAAYSDYSYDAVYVLAEAIKRANSLDTGKIKDEMYRTDFYGATGKVTFDSNGEVMDKPFTIYRVINGKFAVVVP